MKESGWLASQWSWWLCDGVSWHCLSTGRRAGGGQWRRAGYGSDCSWLPPIEHHGLGPIHTGNGIANELLPCCDTSKLLSRECVGLYPPVADWAWRDAWDAHSKDGLVAAASNSSCLAGCKEVQMGHRAFLHQTEEEMEEKLSFGHVQVLMAWPPRVTVVSKDT